MSAAYDRKDLEQWLAKDRPHWTAKPFRAGYSYGVRVQSPGVHLCIRARIDGRVYCFSEYISRQQLERHGDYWRSYVVWTLLRLRSERWSYRPSPQTFRSSAHKEEQPLGEQKP